MSGIAAIAEQKNHYDLLGICREASKEDIKRAYRDMSRIFHPDSNFFSDLIQEPVTPEHVEVFDRITSAYNTLIDEDGRRRYDETLLKGTIPGWDEKPDPEDLAQQFANDLTAVQAKLKAQLWRPGEFGQGAWSKSVKSEPLVERGRHLKSMSEIIRIKRRKSVLAILAGFLRSL